MTTPLMEKREDGYWYMGFPTANDIKWVNTHIQNDDDALKWAEEQNTIDMTLRYRHEAHKDKRALGQFVRDWDAPQRVKYDVERFIREHGMHTRFPSDITSQMVTDWVNRDPVRWGVRANRRKRLRRFFEWLKALDVVRVNPADRNLAKVNINEMPQELLIPRSFKTYTQEEVGKLLDACKTFKRGDAGHDKFWRFSILLACETGLRLGDCATLEWANINLEEKTVTRLTLKRHRLVVLPISPGLCKMLKALKEQQDEHPAYAGSKFVWPYQAGMYNRGSRHITLSWAFGYLTKQAGVPSYGFHSFRRAYIRRRTKEEEGKAKAWWEQPTPIEIVRKEVGHSSATTTKGYLA